MSPGQQVFPHAFSCSQQHLLEALLLLHLLLLMQDVSRATTVTGAWQRHGAVYICQYHPTSCFSGFKYMLNRQEEAYGTHVVYSIFVAHVWGCNLVQPWWTLALSLLSTAWPKPSPGSCGTQVAHKDFLFLCFFFFLFSVQSTWSTEKAVRAFPSGLFLAGIKSTLCALRHTVRWCEGTWKYKPPPFQQKWALKPAQAF